jgi:protein SCO1/2
LKTPALRWALLAACAVIAGIVGGAWLLAPRGQIELRNGTWLATPRALPAFEFETAGGQFTNADLAGHWTLIFPGYTYCPDVCPTVLAALKAIKAKLPADAPLRVVFLSVDPGRDTPEKLAAYTRAFDPGFIGVTASNEVLDRYAGAFGYVYTKVPGTTPDNYLMDHSAQLIVCDPQGRVAAYFSPPFSVSAMTEDLRALLAMRSL